MIVALGCRTLSSLTNTYMRFFCTLTDVFWWVADYSRKKCCYPWDKKDLFTYMSTLIKISNHVALILPGELDVSLDQSYTPDFMYDLAPGDTADQVTLFASACC